MMPRRSEWQTWVKLAAANAIANWEWKMRWQDDESADEATGDDAATRHWHGYGSEAVGHGYASNAAGHGQAAWAWRRGAAADVVGDITEAARWLRTRGYCPCALADRLPDDAFKRLLGTGTRLSASHGNGDKAAAAWHGQYRP